jgi:hypothetical protein
MAYVPIDRAALVNGLAGSSSLYPDIVANHDECYEAHEPPIIDQPLGGAAVAAGVTDSLYYVWRVRGNRDLRTVRIRIRAEAAGGSGTITARLGGATGTATVTGAEAWYTIDLVPLTGVLVAASLSMTTPGGVTMNLHRLQCRTVGQAPAAGQLKSLFRKGYPGMYAADAPIASEHVSRLIDGPVRVALDLPACVSVHLSRITTSGGKRFGDWQGSLSTAWEVVGRSRLPRADEVARDYVIDVHTVESGSGGQAQITIGAASFTIPSMGGTAGGWSQDVKNLGPGPHEIRASVAAGGGNTARITTMQIWRMPRTSL